MMEPAEDGFNSYQFFRPETSGWGGGRGSSSDYNKVCGIEVTPCVFDVLPALKWWQIKVMNSVEFQMNGPPVSILILLRTRKDFYLQYIDNYQLSGNFFLGKLFICDIGLHSQFDKY